MATHPPRIPLLLSSLTVVALGLGLLGGHALADRADDPYAPMDRFAKVYSDIERNYVDELDADTLITAAIEGMVSKLDPHSRWLDEQAFRSLQEETEGRYEGIGVEVRKIDDGVLVVRVMPGGPAKRDGVRPGDRIVSVNGHEIADLDMDDIAAHLRGARGTSVSLGLVRPGQPEPIAVQTVRDRIDLEPVVGEPLPGGVAYVRLVSFQEGSAVEVQRSLRAQRRHGAERGLILDLRDNPGGLLDEAVQLVDLFVDEGPIVTTRGRSEGEQVMGATRGGFPPSMPIVVLVNGGSASASEVVVGALQDLDRATILGTTTFGKGSVQSLFGRDEGGLKLTIARYYTPAGTPVTLREGRTPDIEVLHPTAPGPKAALQQRLEALDHPQRDELLALLTALPDDESVDPIIAWDEPMAARLLHDPQLRAALGELGVEPPTQTP